MQAERAMPSICIPRVLPGVSEHIIRAVFELVMQSKCIDRIDLVNTHQVNINEGVYQRAFVHFRYCPTNKNAHYIRERLLLGLPLNIVYNEPLFWKCFASKVHKP